MRDCLIIIPTYNEEVNIKKVLSDIRELYSNIDTLVINDGSTDNTEKVVQNEKVMLISLPYNLGYGGALQTGYKYAVLAGYEYVIQIDGDGQHDPEDIRLIIEKMQKGIDIVIGSRFLGRGSYKTSFIKIIAIRIFRSIINISTKVKITDPSSGLQGLSKRAFSYYAKIGNFPPDYPDADILIQMIINGYKIVEFPANIRERKHGTSMHAGLRPIVYFFKLLVSILIVLLRPKSVVEG
ncbi:MAG: glycosyl transferase family 2 [Firmicutes bacterium HGW-Firmicutes-12]|nr:MAG: glycosyl transferase family 2 [Firmicutes bacterium HGW-Firmicutes-12]